MVVPGARRDRVDGHELEVGHAASRERGAEVGVRLDGALELAVLLGDDRGLQPFERLPLLDPAGSQLDDRLDAHARGGVENHELGPSREGRIRGVLRELVLAGLGEADRDEAQLAVGVAGAADGGDRCLDLVRRKRIERVRGRVRHAVILHRYCTNVK